MGNTIPLASGKRQSGLDWTKRTPASLFYLPSQAADPSQSFFHDHGGPDRELLNPVLWIENSVVSVAPRHDLPDMPDQDGTKINEALVQKATSDWRQSPKGEGNNRLWEFALALRRAGLSRNQIKSKLQAEAAFGRSPRERRAQIRSIMDSLRRSRRRAFEA